MRYDKRVVYDKDVVDQVRDECGRSMFGVPSPVLSRIHDIDFLIVVHKERTKHFRRLLDDDDLFTFPTSVLICMSGIAMINARYLFCS